MHCCSTLLLLLLLLLLLFFLSLGQLLPLLAVLFTVLFYILSDVLLEFSSQVRTRIIAVWRAQPIVKDSIVSFIEFIRGA